MCENLKLDVWIRQVVWGRGGVGGAGVTDNAAMIAL